MRYEPYNMENWKKLMQMCYTLGWYGGVKDLVKLTITAGFEVGGAYESWGCEFRIETPEVKNDKGDIIWQSISVTAKTLDDVAKNAIELINK